MELYLAALADLESSLIPATGQVAEVEVLSKTVQEAEE